MGYHYINHRHEIISTVEKYRNKYGTIVWKDAIVELNAFFEDVQIAETWRGRYKRAKSFVEQHQLGMRDAQAQYRMENLIRNKDAIKNATKSILIEEALKQLEDNSVHIAFDKELKNAKQCALICVEYLIEEESQSYYDWIKVKSEIEKL